MKRLIAILVSLEPIIAATLPKTEQPVFPYGAVYFRKSNPPEQDWARDHQTAARIGMNTFRHWFMWGSIEVAPGKYDWRDYDRLIAAQNKIKVVIAAAHGVAGTLESLPSSAHNEWRSSAEVDTWGFTFVASRKGDEPWKQFQAVDLVRGGSRGKPFWHAEAEAGPLWMQPQVLGRPREDGRIPDENDVRLWNLVSCAGGATGILYPRWRPLLDGPLFGAFGPFAMDGSMTPRAEMAGKFARWANAHPDLWTSHPVQGEVGLVFVPESELFNYVQQGSTNFYAQSIRGAYQAFFDSNIQADFVSLDDIGKYKIVYLPYPVMLKSDSVEKLRKYVEQGGTLISEGLPAYFGDHGRAGQVQPNSGLDQVFGAREQYVEFTPDLLENLSLEVEGKTIHGRYFLQEYEAKGGEAAGHYKNGHVAAVKNHYGKGQTLLIGTFPGSGYYLHHSPAGKAFFASLLGLANIEPRLQTGAATVQARLHRGAGGNYLWVVNPSRGDANVTVAMAGDAPAFQSAEDLWGARQVSVGDRKITVSVPARDGAVIALR